MVGIDHQWQKIYAGRAGASTAHLVLSGRATEKTHWTVDLSQAKVTLTLEPPLYFVYIRFTDGKAVVATQPTTSSAGRFKGP